MFDHASVLLHIRHESGREATWVALYQAVYHFVKRALGLWEPLSPQEEDLVYPAAYRSLENVCRYRHTFRGQTEPEARAWLRTICRNAAKREAKRQSHRRRLEVLVAPEDLATHADARLSLRCEPLVRHESIEHLSRCVPNPAWRRTWAMYNDPERRFSHEAIAAMTGRTVGTVRVILSHVRRAIRAGEEMAA